MFPPLTVRNKTFRKHPHVQLTRCVSGAGASMSVAREGERGTLETPLHSEVCKAGQGMNQV